MNSLKLKGVLIENNEKSIDFCKLNGNYGWGVVLVCIAKDNSG